MTRYSLAEVWNVFPVNEELVLKGLMAESRHHLAEEYLVQGPLCPAEIVCAVMKVCSFIRTAAPVSEGERERLARGVAWDALRGLNGSIPGRRWWPLWDEFKLHGVVQ